MNPAETTELSATPDSTERFLSDLGLAARARSLVFGTQLTVEALRATPKPAFVLVASDASDATRKRLCDKCAFYGVRLLSLPIPGSELAHAVGKQASLAALAVLPQPIAALVGKHFAALQSEADTTAPKRPAPHHD